MSRVIDEVAMPDEAPDGNEAPEPTHSETRPRHPGEPSRERVARTSVRPSAFGVPRPSAPPPPVRPLSSSLTPLPAAPEGKDDDDTETRPAIARIANERSRVVDQLALEKPPARAPHSSPPPARPETSLPPSLAPAAPTRVEPARTRRPWISIALFTGMLGLSVVPLWRYAGSGDSARSGRSGPGALHSAPEPALVVAQLNPPSPAGSTQEASDKPDRAQQLAALVSAGTRALDNGAVSEAERLFGRVLELEEDNSRAAFGLARIRLLQGNLAGAEGWVQLALRKRPKRRAYHALYAEILARLRRDDEAQDERAHAEGREPEESP